MSEFGCCCELLGGGGAEYSGDIWDLLQPDKQEPLPFHAFAQYVVVNENPEYDVESQRDSLLELSRPPHMTFAESLVQMSSGNIGNFCRTCLVFRGALKIKTLEGNVVIRDGDLVRAILVPPTDPTLLKNPEVTLTIQNQKIWSKIPDSTGRISLDPHEYIPLVALYDCGDLTLEPRSCKYRVEFILLKTDPRTRIACGFMDLGVYQKFTGQKFTGINSFR